MRLSTVICSYNDYVRIYYRPLTVGVVYSASATKPMAFRVANDLNALWPKNEVTVDAVEKWLDKYPPREFKTLDGEGPIEFLRRFRKSEPVMTRCAGRPTVALEYADGSSYYTERLS